MCRTRAGPVQVAARGRAAGDTLALGDLSRRDGPVMFTCYPRQAHQSEARRSAFSR
ncbi:MAG TPA: hypothetical protein VFD36_01510 [Kofleriaceae bacterium]|nr:hypothetical protein [Kofleriaceae bacterium]